MPGLDQGRLKVWLRDRYCTVALASPSKSRRCIRAPSAWEERTDPTPHQWISKGMVAPAWLTAP